MLFIYSFIVVMSARNSFTAQSCRLTDVAVREAATFNEQDFYS